MATLFTKILNGDIPGKILYRDDLCAAIPDIAPQAPVHILIFPIKELASIAHAEKSDQNLLGHMLLIAKQLAKQFGLDEKGFRLVINTGEDGGQSVNHLHIHILGQRPMLWPPG